MDTSPAYATQLFSAVVVVAAGISTIKTVEVGGLWYMVYMAKDGTLEE